MPLHFRCPCGVVLNSPDGSAGKGAECPTCGKIIVIPQEAISLALADFDVPASNVPAPEVPAPEVPVPEVPASEVPAPEVSAPEAPVPEVPVPEEAAAPEPAPEPAPEAAPESAPEPPAAAPDPVPVFAGVAGFKFNPPSEDPSSVGHPPPSPEASGDEIQRAPPALAEDVPEPEQVFGAEFGRALSVPEGEPDSSGPAAGPGSEEATGGPTLIIGAGELDKAADTEATPVEGTVLEPPAPVVPAQPPLSKPSKPGLKKGTTETGIPRSRTSVVRKRGRKALEALDGLGAGEGGDKPKPGRSRRIPLKGRSVTRKILLMFVVLVLLAVGGLAALIFVPEHLVPEGFRDRLDSFKSTLRELGLPIAPPPPGGRAPGLPARGGGAGETGGGSDAGPEGPAEATKPLPIEK